MPFPYLPHQNKSSKFQTLPKRLPWRVPLSLSNGKFSSPTKKSKWCILDPKGLCGDVLSVIAVVPSCGESQRFMLTIHRRNPIFSTSNIIVFFFEPSNSVLLLTMKNLMMITFNNQQSHHVLISTKNLMVRVQREF